MKSIDKKLLMAAQYDMPLTEQPFIDLAEKLNVEYGYVKNKLQEYLKEGIIIRVAPQLNYRAFRSESYAALVGIKVDEKRIFDVARVINKERGVKHNFLRDDEYNIWFTIKAKDQKTLENRITNLMERCGITDYIVLPSKRVYKMDVKYDLYNGVSWSNRGMEKKDVPLVDDLGLDEGMLKEMERNFEIDDRPFKKFANKYGYKELELVDLIKELMEKRVIRDFYAVLNGEKVGFKENGMNVIKTSKPEKVAKDLLDKIPQITHLVERQTPKKWNYPLYFMVHAFKKDKIEEIAEIAKRINGVEELKILYSKMNLRKF